MSAIATLVERWSHRDHVAEEVTARARLLLDTRARFHGEGVHRL